MSNNNIITKSDYLNWWQYQSTLMWSRIKTSTLLEAGLLGGGYKLWEANQILLLFLVFLCGSFLQLIISVLMHRDSQFMNTLKKIIDDDLPGMQKTGQFPHIGKPFLGMPGRVIAIGIPIFLVFFNLAIFICMFLIDYSATTNFKIIVANQGSIIV